MGVWRRLKRRTTGRRRREDEEGEREARSWGRAALPRSCAQHFNRFHLRACERASEPSHGKRERVKDGCVYVCVCVGRIERQTEAMRVYRWDKEPHIESGRAKESVRTS